MKSNKVETTSAFYMTRRMLNILVYDDRRSMLQRSSYRADCQICSLQEQRDSKKLHEVLRNKKGKYLKNSMKLWKGKYDKQPLIRRYDWKRPE